MSAYDDHGLTHMWRHHLTEEQCNQLAWIQTHKCTVEVDSLDASDGVELVLTVLVDQRSIISTHGGDVRQVFDRAYRAVVTLLSLGTEP
ncbi:hypothetical protein [Deinococcus pimensis]|uniref:hypothetical protein n=1 Tax=Deinococcus pimensis TaxID=309888 RepID=UPI000484E6FC|nr:hypothetical protein [Deinococcus pimensis]